MGEAKKVGAQAFETAGIFVAAVGAMVLILVSSWVAARYIAHGELEAESVGGAAEVAINRSDILAVAADFDTDGQVAGVVDQTSRDEQSLKNDVAEWLSSARSAEGLNVAYRDSILDRNAQNHSRSISNSCEIDDYNSWDEFINLNINEGIIGSFSEATFFISGEQFGSELIQRPVDYQRLFTDYNAFGVGVSAIPELDDCGSGYVLVVHSATVF